MNKTLELGAVIVTFNRLNKLKHTLACYEDQTYPCSEIIIVNNCSTDGTEEFLKEWGKKCTPFVKHILKTKENVGGAGGFHFGMEYALSLNLDWIWVGDDDAYPTKNSFQLFYEYILEHDIDKLAAVCSSVTTIDGKYQFDHRRHIKNGIIWKRVDSIQEEYNKSSFEIDVTSYVGSIYNVKALKKCGLCIEDFFIYYDDSEHSLRLHQYGKIICLPAINVIHDVPQCINNTKNVDWKDYYEIRNSIYTYRKHHFVNALYNTQKYFKVYYNLYWMKIYNKDCIVMMKTAIKDAWKGRLGLHPIYKPGFFVVNNIPTHANWYRKVYKLFHKGVNF